MIEIPAIALFIIPIVIGIVQAVKNTGKIDIVWLPFISMAVAVIIGLPVLGFTPMNFLFCLVIGLSAVGLYEVSKNTTRLIEK